MHPATDFAFQPYGSGADDQKRFVDYEIPIEMFYGRNYRQMQRWIRDGQVRNGNEGLRWNWPPVEMHERGRQQQVRLAGCRKLGAEREDGGTADVGELRTGDSNPGRVSCSGVERIEIDELGPDGQAMKRKAEELLDSVEGRRRIGGPRKQAKADKGHRKVRERKCKDVVLGSGTGGLFGDGEDEDEVIEEDLYIRCLAKLGE